jgi:hypothetical protein
VEDGLLLGVDGDILQHSFVQKPVGLRGQQRSPTILRVTLQKVAHLQRAPVGARRATHMFEAIVVENKNRDTSTLEGMNPN